MVTGKYIRRNLKNIPHYFFQTCAYSLNDRNVPHQLSLNIFQLTIQNHLIPILINVLKHFWNKQRLKNDG